MLAAPIEQIERFRSHRLIPVLTHDVDTISDFAFAFAPLAISLTVTLGCLGYLAMLSWPMFLLMLAAIAVGTSAQYLAQSVGVRGFMAARDAEDDLQRQYNAVAGGARNCASTAHVATACSCMASRPPRISSARPRSAQSTPS